MPDENPPNPRETEIKEGTIKDGKESEENGKPEIVVAINEDLNLFIEYKNIPDKYVVVFKKAVLEILEKANEISNKKQVKNWEELEAKRKQESLKNPED